MNYTDIIKAEAEKTIAKLESLGFPRIDIQYVVTKINPKTAGQARYKGNIVTINELYMKDHEQQIVEQTLPHEICHLYQHKYFPTAKQAHGPEWKRLMMAVGCKPDTYHSMIIPEQKANKRKKIRYIYTTECGKTARLTKQQHEHVQIGYKRFSIAGKVLTWTNKSEYIA